MIALLKSFAAASSESRWADVIVAGVELLRDYRDELPEELQANIHYSVGDAICNMSNPSRSDLGEALEHFRIAYSTETIALSMKGYAMICAGRIIRSLSETQDT
jgi:hypothetical protein